MPGSDDEEMAIANFDGEANGGGSDVTEVIKEEEDAASSERGAVPDHPPATATATAAPFHDEDDHYDNIQVRPPAR